MAADRDSRGVSSTHAGAASPRAHGVPRRIPAQVQRQLDGLRDAKDPILPAMPRDRLVERGRAQLALHVVEPRAQHPVWGRAPCTETWGGNLDPEWTAGERGGHGRRTESPVEPRTAGRRSFPYGHKYAGFSLTTVSACRKRIVPPRAAGPTTGEVDCPPSWGIQRPIEDSGHRNLLPRYGRAAGWLVGTKGEYPF